MMNSNNYSKAKILVLIPILIFVFAVLCMGFAMALEKVTNRGSIYTIFAFFGLMCIFLAPLPCLVMSIVGIVLAVRAVKEGISRAKIVLVIGVLEVLVHVLCVILAIAMFIGGMSV